MKTILIALFLMLATSAGHASELNNVKKLKERKNGNFKVKCLNKVKGKVSFEIEELENGEEDKYICVFAKTNKKFAIEGLEAKNVCKHTSEWTVEQAAEFLCADN